jgi:hypothetical protein
VDGFGAAPDCVEASVGDFAGAGDGFGRVGDAVESLSGAAPAVGWAGTLVREKRRDSLVFCLAGAGWNVAGSAAGTVATPIPDARLSSAAGASGFCLP